MIRPLRSLLFAPAIDRRKVDKALSLDADAVIVDLEDVKLVYLSASAPAFDLEGLRDAGQLKPDA